MKREKNDDIIQDFNRTRARSRTPLLKLLLLPWNEKHLFRGVKHGKDVIFVNYPREDFHGTFIARTNTISVEYHVDNPFPRN
jgi:hypothetical protein